MKIIKLELTNFRGIRHLAIDMNGMDTVIRGKNGVGKTTIVHAFTWLLTGKSSDGDKSISPKVLDFQGKEIHHLENSVKGTFQLDDGSLLMLQKVNVETWSNKKAQNQTYEGNTIKYYIDGVPSKKKDFDQILASLIDPEKLKMLSMSDYFVSTMKWQDRRKLLTELTGGDITTADVIMSNEVLKDFPKMLEAYSVNYTPEQLLKVAKSEKDKLKKDLEQIPVRINENQNQISLIAEKEEDLSKEKDSLEATISDLKTEKASLKHSDILQDYDRKIAEIDLAYAKAEAEYIKSGLDNELQKEIRVLKDTLSANSDGINNYTRQIRELKNKKADMETKREQKLAEYDRTAKTQWTGDTVCPCCGQPIPEEKIEEAKKVFNLQKSEKLNQINEEGSHYSSKKIAEVEKEITAKQELSNALSESSAKVQSDLNELKRQLDNILPFKETATAESILGRKNELLEEKKQAEQNQEATLSAEQKAIDDKISEKEAELSGIKGKLTIIENNRQAEQRVDQLIKQETDLSQKYSDAEYKEDLCKLYTKTMMELVEQRINSRFKNIQFKLFDTHINGEIAECCEVMIPCESGLIPYGEANYGGQIVSGLEVINELSEHWNKHMPVFIDNAESLTWIPEMDTQVIMMKATPDSKLCFEFIEKE